MIPEIWWHEAWLDCVGSPPARPSSREESVQQLLAQLLLGRTPADFMRYPLTTAGHRVITAIWRRAFHDVPSEIDWFVSEYELPVPPEWRDEIRLTYRAPDFACGVGNRILIIELKTEWGSYAKAQITDFLRLARRLHPDAHIDLLLLEERIRGASQDLDGRQRYAEMTWSQLASILRTEVPEQDLAIGLYRFLDTSLAGGSAAQSGATCASQPQSLSQATAPLRALIATAVDQALRMAPALEAAPTDTRLARGIDVPFESVADLRVAEVSVREALEATGHAGISTWLWRTTSSGPPATPAGRDSGFELRLQPKRPTRVLIERNP